MKTIFLNMAFVLAVSAAATSSNAFDRSADAQAEDAILVNIGSRDNDKPDCLGNITQSQSCFSAEPG